MTTAHIIDFDLIDEKNAPLPVRPIRSGHGKTKSMTPKQLRARARRNRREAEKAMNLLYKPVEEWDEAELARGRPRDSSGGFRGKSPGWVTRAMHEEAVNRFKTVLKGRMNQKTPAALDLISTIIDNDALDEDGKALVPYPTRLSAATFLVEHAVGKPKQRTESEISLKLQGLLAHSVVVPGQLPAASAQDDPQGLVGDDDILDLEDEDYEEL